MKRPSHTIESIANAVSESPGISDQAACAARWLAFQRNADLLGPPPLDQSQEARMRRKIQRIADRHRWQSAINHFLDLKFAAGLEDLTYPQLQDLLGRMQGHVDAAEAGCDLPDDLPAR